MSDSKVTDSEVRNFPPIMLFTLGVLIKMTVFLPSDYLNKLHLKKNQM